MRQMHTRTKCAYAACLLLLAGAANSFETGFHIGQWPQEMIDRKSEWATALAGASGVMGIGAAVLTPAKQNEIIGFFSPASPSPRFRVHILTWAKILPFVEMGPAGKAAFDAEIAKTLPLMATSDTIRFVYDQAGSTRGTLTVAQLDKLRAAGFHKVLVIFHKWDNTNKEAIQAAILHPWCLGIVPEGTPLSMRITGSAVKNPRLGAIDFVMRNTQKRVFVLVPPGTTDVPDPLPTQVERYKALLDVLKNILGKGLLCSKRLAIIPAAFPTQSTGLTFFPGLTDRTKPTSFANTIVGTMLYMTKAKTDYCPPA